MIYLCVWENYFRQQLLKSWKDAFSKKFSEFNIFHIHSVTDYDIGFYSQNFLSSWFFSEKNLFIIDDFPGLSGEVSWDIEKYYNFFLENLSAASPEHVIVFNSQKVDKRSKLYKLIVQIWEIKNFEIPDIPTLKQKLSQLFSEKIQPWVIDIMIEKKGNNFENIKNELDKILITKNMVELSDIKNIGKDIEENIFEIIDDILQCNTKNAILKLRDLSDFLDNPYLLYNSLLANLRFYFYIFSLRKRWVSSSEIKTDLDVGKRWFLVDKKYKISDVSFFQLYDSLIFIDQQMKQWKLLWSGKQEFLYELEKSILLSRKN